MRLIGIWRVCLAVGCLMGVLAHGASSVTLGSAGAGDQRWKDVAHTVYAEAYRTTYTYDQAHVFVSYEEHADTFVGRLVAANLKPNFAYQIKLEAVAGSACAERLGSVGRYWREEWDGSKWVKVGIGNLNDKGDGYSPSPNDDTYLAGREEEYVSGSEVYVTASGTEASPTGLRYRFTMYLLLGYMITDERGNATVDLRLDSSYHVLWREDQRTRLANDGPVVSRTFTPSAADPAYDSDGAEQTVGVFGEWERLPSGGLRLPDGDYSLSLVLTEESFHHGDEFDGWWPTVMTGQLAFASGLPPVFSTHPQSQLARTGDSIQLSAALVDETGTTVSWRVNGLTIPWLQTLEVDLGEVVLAHAANYVCVASNDFGETLSQAAVLMVRDDLRTEAEYVQAVAERDAQITALETQVASMFTAGEVDAAIVAARPDRDGDGFTDQQEIDRGSDPDLYTIPVEPGWNLISLARVPEDNTVAGIFGTAGRSIVGDVWQWDTTALRYQVVDRLEPLRGHWLFWDGEQTDIEISLPEHGR